jgi:hypothetical protein
MRRSWWTWWFVAAAACGFPRPADVPECRSSVDCTSAGAPACDTTAGVCVGCVDASACSADKPVCDLSMHACRACARHADCASHVCTDQGLCATEDTIAHADPAGSTASDCGTLSPCTLTRALALMPTRMYVLLAPGTYRNSSTITVAGKRVLIGDGDVRAVVTATSPGPIFAVDVSSDVTFDHLQLSGAKGGTPPATGDGVQCNATAGQGIRTVRFVDALATQNAGSGALLLACSIVAVRSTFSENGDSGIRTTDSAGTIDRCTFSGNTGYGINLDAGLYTVTNSFSFRNGTGIEIYPSQPGNVVAFNTVVDNMVGVSCVADVSSSGAFANNLLARNATSTGGSSSCTFPNSIIVSDVTTLHFVHPDAAPYDYHLGSGSVAIDRAASPAPDHDFDGDARPKGGASDVGADEAQ